MTEPDDHESDKMFQELAKRMADEAMSVLCGAGAFTKPRPTALRLTGGGSFEVVELDDDGKPIERCPDCGPLWLCSKHIGS